MKYFFQDLINLAEKILFASRFLLVILYAGLTLGLAAYSYKFVEELWVMLSSLPHLTTETTMLALLGLVDITMVANLIVMSSIGGFSIFIKQIKTEGMENKPRFMNNITSSGLKVKMGSSLVGVTSIHLLKKFIEGNGTWQELSILLSIHGIFIISMLALYWVDKGTNHSHDTANTHNKEK